MTTLTNITLARFLTTDTLFKFVKNLCCKTCSSNIFIYKYQIEIFCYICNHRYTYFDTFEKVVKLNTIEV